MLINIAEDESSWGYHPVMSYVQNDHRDVTIHLLTDPMTSEVPASDLHLQSSTHCSPHNPSTHVGRTPAVRSSLPPIDLTTFVFPTIPESSYAHVQSSPIVDAYLARSSLIYVPRVYRSPK